MKIDVTDLLLGVCLLAAIAAGFAWSLIAGFIVVALASGFLAVATADSQTRIRLRLPKVRWPWRS